MAQSSDVNMRICLLWNTKKPFIGISSQSSPFRLHGRKWHLEIELFFARNNEYICVVWLKRATVGNLSASTGTCINVTTYVLVKGAKSLKNNHCSTDINVGRKKRENLFSFNMAKKEFLAVNADWTIICLLKCNKPLSLHVNNETMHLSNANDSNSPQKSKDKCVQASPEIPPGMEELSCDFSKLLEKKILPDVKLKCGSQTISVHRSILAGRSEVFASMFQSKMSETESGIVDVADMEAPILDLLLKYAYSGKIEDISEDSAAGLYEAGDRYAMHSLKKACSDWIVRNLGEENCIGYLYIADAHTDFDFKAAVMSFIIKHPKVLKSTLWLTLSKEHSDLAVELLQGFADSIVK